MRNLYKQLLKQHCRARPFNCADIATAKIAHCKTSHSDNLPLRCDEYWPYNFKPHQVVNIYGTVTFNGDIAEISGNSSGNEIFCARNTNSRCYENYMSTRWSWSNEILFYLFL